MTHGSLKPHFADHGWYGRVTIEEIVPLARDTFRLRFACPEMARRFVPGQFLMIRLSGSTDPLLGRPMALYDTVFDAHGAPRAIDVVFLVVGKLTGKLAEMQAGDPLEVWGPLGNGFPAKRVDHLVMVAGGIGQTPFLALAQEYLGLRPYGAPRRRVSPAKRITLCYGARSADYLAGVEDFRQTGIDVEISTDDGTAGHHGLVTDVLRRVLDRCQQPPHIVCCGPEPMLRAVAGISAKRRLPCQVSLETPMACGLGICFSCVTRVRDDAGHWDYRRTCIDGPVFDARQIVFDDMPRSAGPEAPPSSD